jgi:hypothetical protein
MRSKGQHKADSKGDISANVYSKAPEVVRQLSLHPCRKIFLATLRIFLIPQSVMTSRFRTILRKADILTNI